MIKGLTGKNYAGYSTAFFDFDGTIMESGEGIVNALKYAFTRIGMAIPEEKELLSFVGPPVKIHLSQKYGMEEKQAAEAYAFFREYYFEKGLYEGHLYDGIADALKRIKQSGKTLYIATCKTESTVRDMLRELSLEPLFTDAFGAWHERGISDKTQVLQNAMQRLGGLPGHAVMIGDRSYDMIGGRAVGLDTAGVLYGYGNQAELVGAGCDYLLDTVADLEKMLGGKEE